MNGVTLMFFKYLLVAALTLASATAMSQEAKKEEKKEEKVTDLSNQNYAYTAFDYLKKKFTLSYHGEYYLTRRDITSANTDDHDLQDLKIMHSPTVVYRPVENWKFVFNSEFKYSDAVDSSFPNRHFRSIAILTREKILLEKEHGFRLDAGVTRRFNDRVVARAKDYGNSRAFVTLYKTWMEKHASNLVIQYMRNDPAEGQTTNRTFKHALNLIPTITWNITSKLSWLFNDDFVLYSSWNDTEEEFKTFHDMNIAFISYAFDDKNSSYFQFKYIQDESFNTARNRVEYFPYYIGHTYAFTPKMSLTAELGSNMFESKDGRAFFAKAMEYPEFALYFDFAL